MDCYEYWGHIVTTTSLPAIPQRRKALSDEEKKEAFSLVLRNYFNFSDEKIKEYWEKEERA